MSFRLRFPETGSLPLAPTPTPPPKLIYLLIALSFYPFLSLSLFFVGIIAFFVLAAHRFPQTQVSAVFLGCWWRSRVGGGEDGGCGFVLSAPQIWQFSPYLAFVLEDQSEEGL